MNTQTITVQMDGNTWHAARADFINLQESTSGWGDTPAQAVIDLVMREEKETKIIVLPGARIPQKVILTIEENILSHGVSIGLDFQPPTTVVRGERHPSPAVQCAEDFVAWLQSQASISDGGRA